MRVNRRKRSMKRYALLKPDAKHGLVAMIDMPMRMGWSHNQVCTWNSPPTHYWKKGYFIVRIGSKNCPIKVARTARRNYDFIMHST